MDKFKDINEYFNYLDKVQDKALNQVKKIYFLKNGYKEILDYTYLKMNANPAMLEKVKKGMTKKLFDHLNGFDLTIELDILDLTMIISYLNEVKFHKKQNMSTDGHEFAREIKKIKKDTDRINLMNLEKNITIKLPQSSHLIKYALIEYFKARAILSDESIKNISLLFGKKMPRKGVKSTDKIHDLYSKLGENFMAKLKEGAILTSIDNSIDDDPIYKNEIKDTEYYTPIHSTES